MFPSCTGDNSFPQFQPSFYSSTSFVGLNGNENAVHHHHDLLVHHVSVNASASDTVSSWASLTKPILINQDMNRLNGDHCAPLGNLPKTRPVNKDRHSKIVTAQGPRDRRVRLSIDIAQKFFGLQDMLGFDKASKTLDWLLTKSKTAIEELVQMKHSGNALANVQSSGSECEVVMGIEAAENGGSEGDSSVNLTKLATAKQPQNGARESRANARARARERTRKKMCTMAEKHPGTRASESLPLNQLVASEGSGSHICHISTIKADIERDESIYHHILTNAIAAKEIIQDPLSLKRKITPSSMFGFQPNLIISNDTSSKDNSFPYTTGNWDTASRVTRSTMYAMTNISSSKDVLKSSIDMIQS